MATCGHCKQPDQTVAHVRTCGQGAVATAQLPELTPGNVVTIDLEDGYWLVEAVWDHPLPTVQASRLDATQRAVEWPLRQVELVFPNESAAVDYRLAQRTETILRRNREILHGDPDYCRGCVKGWSGEKWHRTGCPVIAARQQANTQTIERADNLRRQDVWKQVDGLRERGAKHLHRETRQGGSPRVEGRFAIVVDGTTKFLRIKKITAGRWAGRVFVDSQASDDYYPVKVPATLLAYLSAVLANPEAAAKRYADELDACSMCGRTLTNDESRARGIGPECWSKWG
jgi:hypothetical protein